MKRGILIGFALIVGALMIIASELRCANTGKIKGKVTDAKTHQSIPGVVVLAEGTSLGAQSDLAGEYVIANVPEGSYRLTAKLVGYQTKAIEALSVLADHVRTQDFALEPAPIQIEDQVVKAERELLKLSESHNIRQLSSEDIKNMPVSHSRGITQVSPQVFDRQGKIDLRGGRYNGGNEAANRAPKSYALEPQIHFRPGGCVPPPNYPPAHGGTTPPNGQPYDAMFFQSYGVNPFISTEDDHLSTFAVDCDNASYSMTRSYLSGGNLPPAEAVRVEEFINNFDYHYTAPQSRAFDLFVEGAPSKFGKNYQLLKVGIVGKKIDERDRLDANLVFVVDCSGSMARENRIELVKRALHMLVDNLSTRDRVSIVGFSDNAFEISQPTFLGDKERIDCAIDAQVYPRGSTNAEAGIRMGYQMADRCFKRGCINRVIVCSDGVANVGLTSADDIFNQIKSYADKGITLSTIGVGMGNYNDALLEQLGDKGNGHYAYVDTWDEARRVFMENLTGTLQVIARDVKIQVDFDPNTVDRYRLLGYENRDVADNQFRDDSKDGGEIGFGHRVTALYEIKLKDRANGELGQIFVRYKDPENFRVKEVSGRIDAQVIKSSFEAASTNFRLAAAAAEFAEILRGSYWAKDGTLSEVLKVAQTVEGENPTPEIREFVDLVGRANALKAPQDGGEVPLSLKGE